MKITVRWGNPSYGVTEFRVYRDTAPLDVQALPSPIATVAPQTLEFEDTTVVENEDYHYLVSSLIDGQEYFGDQEQISTELTLEVIRDTIFANGELGAMYHPAPEVFGQPAIFQDTAGATPALAGDPVARIEDLSGNGLHLLQSTSNRRAVAQAAPSVLCDGVDDYLQTANINGPTGSWSIAYWIKPVSYNAGSLAVTGGLDCRGTRGIQMRAPSQGVLTGRVYSFTTSRNYDYAVSPFEGSWQHHALTFDQSSRRMRFYLNGSLHTETFPSYSTGSSSFRCTLGSQSEYEADSHVHAEYGLSLLVNREMLADEVAMLNTFGEPLYANP